MGDKDDTRLNRAFSIPFLQDIALKEGNVAAYILLKCQAELMDAGEMEVGNTLAALATARLDAKALWPRLDDAIFGILDGRIQEVERNLKAKGDMKEGESPHDYLRRLLKRRGKGNPNG